MSKFPENCINTINDHILNRCLAQKYSLLIREINGSLFYYFRPNISMALLIILQLVLPYIFKHTVRSNRQKAKSIYEIVKYAFLSIFHQIVYAYTLVPWVSYWIYAPGPCSCDRMRAPSHNFPYAYSIANVITGLIILEYSKFIPYILYPLGFIVLIVPSILYVLGGWASIAQCISSCLIGVFLHYMSILTPIYFRLIEDVLLLIANFVTLGFSIKANLAGVLNDSVPSQIIHGIGSLIYDFWMNIRFLQKNNWAYGNVSHEMVAESKESKILKSSLLSIDDSAQFLTRMNSDSIDVVIGFIEIIVVDGINKLVAGL